MIDSLGGIRALLNETIRQLYREYASDQKFVRDIYTRNTIAMTAGVGACPDTIMREFLHLSEITDTSNSFVTYYNYSTDGNSGQNFNQLGYVWLVGDNFTYRAPAPVLATYTDNLFVTTPCFPTLPVSMASAISFPSQTVVDDLCSMLAMAIMGQLKEPQVA